MAAKAGTSSDTLTALRAIEERPFDFDFFTVMRLIESFHPDKPRLGEAARPQDEPIRLAQEPSLSFATSTLQSFRAGQGTKPHQLVVNFFGLFGPHGPLPLHLTEYVRDREINSDDPTFRRFADIFHHRMLLLFYRAWANANPSLSLDRERPQRFDTFVGSTFGIASEGMRNRDEAPDSAKLFLSGLLALPSRPAGALLSILSEFTQLPFRLREYLGAWMRLAHDDWSRLGSSSRGGRLGVDVLLGQSVWTCQNRFRLICGPLRFEEFRRMLPGRDSLARLSALVRNYLGDEFDWDLNLILVKDEVPAMRLGESGELGWTSWLGERQTSADADEVVVHPLAQAI